MFKLILHQKAHSVTIGKSSNPNFIIKLAIALFWLKNDVSVVDSVGTTLMDFTGSKFKD